MLQFILAASVAAAMLMPIAAEAQNKQVVNTTRSNIKHPGIVAIDPNDAAAVAACKEHGGENRKAGRQDRLRNTGCRGQIGWRACLFGAARGVIVRRRLTAIPMFTLGFAPAAIQFYLLIEGQWPKSYGIGGHPVPLGYWQQFLYPFRR